MSTTRLFSLSRRQTFVTKMFGCAAVISIVLGLFQSNATTKHSQSAFSSLPDDYYSDPSSVSSSSVSSFSTSTSTTTLTPSSITISTPPNRTTTTTGESFSACLLWMDDNPRLVEWIAYHYYMLNLTYLVLGVAPGAITSPHSILHRWRDRITIKVWKLQALNEKEKKNIERKKKNESSMEMADSGGGVDHTLMDVQASNSRNYTNPHKKHWYRHKDRQTRFYQTCAFFLKDQNRTWTAFHDVDEFIVFRGDSTRRDSSSRGRGIIRTSTTDTNNVITNTTRNHSTMIIPPPGIVLQYLQQYNHDHDTLSEEEFNATWNFWSIHSPCLQIPRALFGAVPSTDAEVMRGVPSELIHQLQLQQQLQNNTSNSTMLIASHNQSVSAAVDFTRQLVTLNYRYQITRSRHNRMDMDGVPKVVMDVSKMDPVKLLRSNSSTTPNYQTYIHAPNGSAHRPFREFCPYTPYWFSEHKPPFIPLLRIHHYLGSWELYSFRTGDARRSGNRNYEIWAERAHGQAGGVQDAFVRPWLAGFVAYVGNHHHHNRNNRNASAALALALLQGAGLPQDYRVSESYTRSWSYNKSSGVRWNAKNIGGK